MTKEYQAPPSAKPLDLRGAYLKIERAKKHISDLDAQRVAFLGTDPYHGVPSSTRKRIAPSTSCHPSRPSLTTFHSCLGTPFITFAAPWTTWPVSWFAASTLNPIGPTSLLARVARSTKPTLADKHTECLQRPKMTSTEYVHTLEETMVSGSFISLTSSTNIGCW
jgi:hypothetical protein